MIRDVSAGEVMATFHFRGKVVNDEYSDRYANRPFKKVFAAQQKVRDQLQEMFDTAPDAFSKPRKRGGANISLKKRKQIEGLLADGVKPAEIARVTGVSTQTVCTYKNI